MRPMTMSRARVPILLAVLPVLAAVGHLAFAAPGAGPQSVTSETIAAESVRAAGALDTLLPKQAETIYRTVSARFQAGRAMEVVTFMDRYWRLPGNTGFDATIDHLEAGLREAGFREGAPTASS